MLPTISGVIDRRILVNYHVAPEVLAELLPAPFRPKLVAGLGMAGICLIRLRALRPRFVPRFLGFASDNAAHRIAVEWTENGHRREGVYVTRRDSNSRFNAIAGGRLFPGIHHRARFADDESSDRIRITAHSDDGTMRIALEARRTQELPHSSVFTSVDQASEFFRAGALGFSPTRENAHFEALELECQNWHVEPLEATDVYSSFFADEKVFAPDSIALDCVLLMRGIEHKWHARPSIQVTTAIDR